MTVIEELEDIVKKGIVADIFRMERAYELNFAIGESSDRFNDKGGGNYGELFGTIQSALELEAALAVARIFDVPSQKYPTRCIKRALDVISKHAEALPHPVERYNTIKTLEGLSGAEKVISSLDGSPADFATALSGYFYSIIDSGENKKKIMRLKNLRDKRMAHNEVSAPDGPTWEALSDLVTLGQEFVGVVGWAYFSTVYLHEGKYTLSDDAKRSSRALGRLSRAIFESA